MSILLRLKNKLQDPSLYEVSKSTLRRLSERIYSLLLDEDPRIRWMYVTSEERECWAEQAYWSTWNIGKSKNSALDSLWSLFQYKTGINRPQTQFLEEYIRQLEDENGRLTLENQCQREEYERFLERLTPMVLKTAVMQEVTPYLPLIIDVDFDFLYIRCDNSWHLRTLLPLFDFPA